MVFNFRRADVNHNETALTLASKKGSFEIVKYLVENGAYVNEKGGS